MFDEPAEEQPSWAAATKPEVWQCQHSAASSCSEQMLLNFQQAHQASSAAQASLLLQQQVQRCQPRSIWLSEA